MNRAGIKVLPHIFNAIILTSAWSAGITTIVEGPRILFALGSKSQDPKIFSQTNERGILWFGITFVSAFLPLADMSCSESSSTVFRFQELVSSNTLLRWITIFANHIHMGRALKSQGYSRSYLPYRPPIGPYAAWFSAIMSVIFLLTGGLYNFIIPLVLALFTFWKLFKKTRYLRPHKVDLKFIFEDIAEKPENIPLNVPF